MTLTSKMRIQHLTTCSPNRLFRPVWLLPLMAVMVFGGSLFAYSHYMRSIPPTRNECVILLHGLLRSAASMTVVEHHLIRQGYGVINIDYASTQTPIHSIAKGSVATAVAQAKANGYHRIHVVTHSLGALIIRSYLQEHQLPEGSRIVMLAPPNQGSELADWARKKFPRLIQMVGPAAAELGTEAGTLISMLNPITPETGIIIGQESWNPFFSKILPGADDGAVTVERARLEEMEDFLVVQCNHTSIILDEYVRQEVVYFLRSGQFMKKGSVPDQTEDDNDGSPV